jgi:hypothetical protein
METLQRLIVDSQPVIKEPVRCIQVVDHHSGDEVMEAVGVHSVVGAAPTRGDQPHPRGGSKHAHGPATLENGGRRKGIYPRVTG